jgi:hypothetical protein
LGLALFPSLCSTLAPPTLAPPSRPRCSNWCCCILKRNSASLSFCVHELCTCTCCACCICIAWCAATVAAFAPGGQCRGVASAGSMRAAMAMALWVSIQDSPDAGAPGEASAAARCCTVLCGVACPGGSAERASADPPRNAAQKLCAALRAFARGSPTPVHGEAPPTSRGTCGRMGRQSPASRINHMTKTACGALRQHAVGRWGADRGHNGRWQAPDARSHG